ncbi:dTDP-4-dehydrorhamnose 3,5-epimerase [Patescibacteria group bacterium]|nr:dTDP-4-dehydrorhamnose 3,5-epimerase [Patescibacteria group bacterium]
MNFLPTDHPDVIRIQPKVFKDDRGFFMETYQKDTFAEAGIPFEFVQDNHSSSNRATLRGLHYQITHSQGKLVRVVIGEIYDVAVDLRKSSPFFGTWVGETLSAENKEQLWIPPGFAHGFYTLSQRADVVYKATNYYDPSGERCIRWDDPDLGINWPIPEHAVPIISSKDAAGSPFLNAEAFA